MRSIAEQVKAHAPEASLEELKAIKNIVDAELAVRKTSGDRKTVIELMHMAQQFGWVQHRDGNVLEWLEKRLVGGRR